MKKIIKNIKKNKNQLVLGMVLSLFILIGIMIFVIIKKTGPEKYLPAIMVTQLGVSLLWFVARLGGFSILSSSSRKLGTSIRDRKMNKLGGYSSEEKKGKAKTPWEIEEEAKQKSKAGIYLMWIIVIIETAGSLPFII